MAAGAIALGLAQAGMGAIQRGSSNKRRRKALAEFDYNISSATKEQMRMARGRASRNGLPGEDITRSRFESDVARSVEKGEGVAETSSDVLGLYQKMQGNKMDLNRQVLEKGAQYKSENELQLMKTMGLMAEAENQQFYYNKMVPFMSEMGYAGDEAAGGSANIASGLQTAYQGWMNNFTTQQFDEQNQVGDGVDIGSDAQTDFTRQKLEANADQWLTQAPQAPNELTTPITELNPWDADWQRKNPVQYPPS